MSPCLPKDDADPRGRAAELEMSRSAYVFNYDYHGIVSVESLPLHDKSDPKWWAAVLEMTAKLEVNQLASRSAVENVEALGASIAKKLSGLLPDKLTERRRADQHARAAAQRVVGTEQYRRMYATIDAPPVVDLVARDDIFAWQALAGCNPVMLRRMTRPLDHFAVTEAHFRKAVPGGDTLAAAMAEGRLYLADYAAFEGIAEGTTDGFKKYNFAPLALYVWQPAGGLRAVAIQTGQTPGPVFTPADGASWRMAKNTVRTGEGNYQGVISHFALCHQVMESVILSTRRQLAERHPLRVLLEPHFANTLITNDIAMSNLIGPDGYMDRLQSGTLEASLEVANAALRDFRLMESAPEDDFAARGVGDAELLGDYPFRDDLRSLWGPVERFVDDYLRLYYTDDADVSSDAELAAWVREMGAPDGGQLRGLSVPQTVSELVALVARIVFRCTAHHASINYTSFDFFSYAPNVTAAAFGPGPIGGDADTVEAADRMLPPYELAYAGFYLFNEITIQLNRLGHYPTGYFRDPRVRGALSAYHQQLDEVETTIETRNQTRLMAYPYLLPSKISNSIHV